MAVGMTGPSKAARVKSTARLVWVLLLLAAIVAAAFGHAWVVLPVAFIAGCWTSVEIAADEALTETGDENG